MEGILLEEEQISLLGKMLYYSADHLTEREREAYDHLVEGLLRKVNQLRALERRHTAHSGVGPGAGDVSEAQRQRKKSAIANLRPEEVIKMFVDAWNKQDFETEYFCLARCFPAAKRRAESVQEYVLHRMRKYTDRMTVGPIMKRTLELTCSPVHGNKTSVYCVETHRMPDKDLTLHREYDMLYEDNAWRIADFETVRSRATSTVGKPVR